jgi:hypothetical protein
MIYLLTAIGLTPGGSSTVHVYIQTVHRTKMTTRNNTMKTQNNSMKTQNNTMNPLHPGGYYLYRQV